MKVVHALCLASIGAFMVLYTRKFKVLNERHYYQVLSMTVFVTIIYVLPLFYICYVSYRDAGYSFLGYHAIMEGSTPSQW